VLEVAVVARSGEIRDVVPVAYVVARDQDNPPTTSSERASRQLAPQARPARMALDQRAAAHERGKVRRFRIGTDTAG
jgi:crotonobetaine/carnitine-CoA ligase